MHTNSKTTLLKISRCDGRALKPRHRIVSEYWGTCVVQQQDIEADPIYNKHTSPKSRW